ncbi:MAG: sodium:proton antiporter [Gammaproteobacteria bacterium]|nr:sodium:proton antiporter [Gammaproteobacteria bacterium]|tara:strand:+ start:147961 stop:149121 length:1161 start_codon:yes stop_codon:yes gene_type:complete
MDTHSLLFIFFLIFGGAAFLATLALFLRQPLLIAYIVLGVLLGPYALGFVAEESVLIEIADFGILFLLYLLGLDMQPNKLIKTLRNSFFVTLYSAVIFLSLGLGTGLLFKFSVVESLVIGVSMIFSSTIIGIKLLPTTVLHQRHMGEIMVGILLLQDIIAILALVFLDIGNPDLMAMFLVLGALALILLIAFLATRYILLPLFLKFDQFLEYVFLLAIGWCLSLSTLASLIGLSAEIGAFIAGVSLAVSPIAMYITEKLKPLRDFFLILFFFSLGAQFNIYLLGEILIPVLMLSVLALSLKPVIFRYLLSKFSDRKDLAWDAGLRLGQISEFSLLIAFVATQSALIGEQASLLIQAASILTFLVSSYIVVMFCPTPIGNNPRLRRD